MSFTPPNWRAHRTNRGFRLAKTIGIQPRDPAGRDGSEWGPVASPDWNSPPTGLSGTTGAPDFIATGSAWGWVPSTSALTLPPSATSRASGAYPPRHAKFLKLNAHRNHILLDQRREVRYTMRLEHWRWEGRGARREARSQKQEARVEGLLDSGIDGFRRLTD